VATLKRSPNYTVLIYTRDTPSNHTSYPVVWAERVRRTSLSTWERRVVYGGPSIDAEEIISSWVQDDYSGGIGIQDANESTDLSSVEFAVMDLRSPKQVVLPPKTLLPAKPSWATGSFMPLGDAVTSLTSADDRFYGAWGTHAAGWIEGTLAFSATDNALSKTPVNTGVQFGGWLFVPCGTDGALALRQSNDATQTLNVQSISGATMPVLAFGTWKSNLYAITTDNRLWVLSALDCESSPIVVGTPGWAKISSSILGDMVLNRSHTPTELVAYQDQDGRSRLWCITNKGAFLYFNEGTDWNQSNIKPSMHPDFGKGAVVWRSGEDLHVPAGGLDMTRFTGGQVEVPLAGPGGRQGVPPEYNGTIVDLEAERSTLYAWIKGLPPTETLTIDDLEAPGDEVAYLSTPTVSHWLGVWTGTAWGCLYEDRDSGGEPTRLHISTAKSSYRLWMGSTDGQPRTQLIPTAFYNPLAKIALQRDPFAAEGWWDSYRYDANMTNWDKIASHCFANTHYASSTEYVDVYYRTDSDLTSDPLSSPAYTLWKRVSTSGRTLFYFDDTEINPRTGLPWREGLPFQWIQFRFRAYRGSNELVSPVWHAFTMHHIRVPQDASSYVIKIPFFTGPGGRGYKRRSGMEMSETLRAYQRGNKMIQLQPNNFESIRGRIVGISEEAWVGGNEFSTVMVLNVVEIGASSNAHQVLG
jgi:hypothetical protein